MLTIIFTSLFSYMFFFSLVIAPTINTNVEPKQRSILLRKIFKKNFFFGLVISTLGVFLSLYQKNTIACSFFLLIGLLFVLNLFVLLPKISSSGEKIKKDLVQYSSRFKKLHLYSVLLYLIQMISSLVGVYITF